MIAAVVATLLVTYFSTKKEELKDNKVVIELSERLEDKDYLYADHKLDQYKHLDSISYIMVKTYELEDKMEETLESLEKLENEEYKFSNYQEKVDTEDFFSRWEYLYSIELNAYTKELEILEAKKK